MVKKFKWLSILVSVLVAGSLLFGCGTSNSSSNTGNTNSSAQTAGTLKIGVIAPLSGAAIGWGYAVLHGAELAAGDVNAQGGLSVNGKKYNVKIIGYDSLYTAQGGVAAVNRLISEDKVKFIVGPISSAVLLAIQPITEPHKVILISDTYTSQALSKDKPYTFRVTPTTSEFSAPLIKWIAAQNPNAKKVAILSPNDDTGTQVQGDNIKGYQTAGIQVAYHEFYDRNTTDFSSILSKIIASGVDIIDADGSAPATTGQIVKQARQLGFKGLLVKTGGPGTSDVIKVAGSYADGFYYYTPMNPADPKQAAFEQKYSQKYKDTMNGLTPYFYDGTNMLFQAMQAAGTIDDTEAVMKKLESIKDYPGLLGTLNWSGQDTYGINRQIITPTYIGEVKNGKETIVAKVQ